MRHIHLEENEEGHWRAYFTSPMITADGRDCIVVETPVCTSPCFVQINEMLDQTPFASGTRSVLSWQDQQDQAAQRALIAAHYDAYRRWKTSGLAVPTEELRDVMNETWVRLTTENKNLCERLMVKWSRAANKIEWNEEKRDWVAA